MKAGDQASEAIGGMELVALGLYSGNAERLLC